MKLLLTLLPALLTQTTGRRNQRIVIGFLLFTTVLVALFSIVFHQIMAYEGRDYSYITGVYWTLNDSRNGAALFAFSRGGVPVRPPGAEDPYAGVAVTAAPAAGVNARVVGMAL